MHEHTLISLAGIVVAGFACQWFAWRVKLPAILFLLLAGIIAGPATHWLNPDEIFGDLLFPMISLAVAVILFEGSLSLRLHEIRGVEQVVRRLVSSGVLITWTLVALAAHAFLAFPWPLAILFGAMIVVTGPTVIVPMLRTVRPNRHLSNILRWEGIIIDPIGALLAVLVFEFIIAGGFESAFENTIIAFTLTLFIGGLLGVIAGYSLGTILRKHWLPEYLHNIATLTFVFGIFAASNSLQAESGLLAVTIMGLWMANMKGLPVEGIIDFKESLSILLISCLFIILAARIDFAQIKTLGWGALGVFLIIQFIARPLKVAAATYGSSLSMRERLLLGWIAPRGIVAAAIAALFAIRLQGEGYPQAPLLVPLTFLIIIGTVVLQSATARPIARWLGVAEPEPRGFLIIGANPVARVIAQILDKHGFQSLLTDTDWSNIRAAMMHGASTFYGNPVSEYADRRLDLVGIGRVLALAPEREMNVLAAMRYQREFGLAGIYLLPEEKSGSGEKSTGEDSTPRKILFAEDATYNRLNEMLSKEAKIHSTKLTESFDFDDYYKRYYRRALPLFAIDTKGAIHIFTTSHTIKPTAGWTLLGLIEPEKKTGESVSLDDDSAADNS